MAFHPNHLSQEMALQQHFSETENNSVRTILPDHNHLVIAGQSSPSSRSAGKDHWLNSAILRQQGQYGGGATTTEGNSNNFLNLQTNNNSDSAVTTTTSSHHHHHHHNHHQNNNNNNNQWLSRSMLQRNVSDVSGDDVVSQVSNDSIIAAAAVAGGGGGMSSHDSPDINNQSINIVAGGQPLSRQEIKEGAYWDCHGGQAPGPVGQNFNFMNRIENY